MAVSNRELPMVPVSNRELAFIVVVGVWALPLVGIVAAAYAVVDRLRRVVGKDREDQGGDDPTTTYQWFRGSVALPPAESWGRPDHGR